MSNGTEQERTEYTFGPFTLHLLPGWVGSFEEGVHTLESNSSETAIQISGFEREASVELADLHGMVPEGAEGLTRFSLMSGMDGFGWVDSDTQVEHRVIRSGWVILALNILLGEDAPDENREIIESMIATLDRTGETT